MIWLWWECQLKPIIISLTWQATKMPPRTHPFFWGRYFCFWAWFWFGRFRVVFLFSHCFRRPPSGSPWFILLGWFHRETSQSLPGMGPMQRTILNPNSLQASPWMHGVHRYLLKQGHCSYSPGKGLGIRKCNVKASFKRGLIRNDLY